METNQEELQMSPKKEIEPKQEVKQENSTEFVINPLNVINLDDEDEIAKIDEEVHNELNVLFSKQMNLDRVKHDDPLDESDPPCLEPRDAPSMTLIVPLVSCSPSLYDDQDWDLEDLL